MKLTLGERILDMYYADTIYTKCEVLLASLELRGRPKKHPAQIHRIPIAKEMAKFPKVAIRVILSCQYRGPGWPERISGSDFLRLLESVLHYFCREYHRHTSKLHLPYPRRQHTLEWIEWAQERELI